MAMLKVDFAANARSLGAHAMKAGTLDELKTGARGSQDAGSHHGDCGGDGYDAGVPGYESWWDVAVAEVSEMESVREARASMKRRGSANVIICEAGS